MEHGAARKVAVAVADPPARPGSQPACCPHYHQAVELVGKRWTGAIIAVMINEERPLRFSEVAGAIPQLSDRLLSERMKELEARGLVQRRVCTGTPVRVEYELTDMGRDLERAVAELRRWARSWIA
jgi:DNA-binding HxlR family transcriptional regulator